MTRIKTYMVLFFLSASHVLFAVSFVHQGQVSAVSFAGEGTFFTAGEDGFVAKWNVDKSEHYQLSLSPIKALSVSANGIFVAVYETDGEAVNRVSVWDWTTKQRKFARRFNYAITSLSFSPKGTYLIVGTTSQAGAVFLMPETGSVISKLKTNIGPLSYAALSRTEQTLFAYSSQGMAGAGSISYIDMKTGLVKLNNGNPLRFSTVAGLKQATLFHNNVFFAGVAGNAVKIVSADSGSVSASFPARNPVILQDASDENLYYIDESEGALSLIAIETEGRKIGEPRVLCVFDIGDETVLAGKAYGTQAVFATNKGNVYLADADEIALLTDETYSPILDAASNGERFYFLTPESVIESSYDDPSIVHIADNGGSTNMAVWNEGIVLWSRGKARPASLIDIAQRNMAKDYIGGKQDDDAPIVLFSPKAAITSLHVNDGKIVYVEGERSVKVFDIKSMKSTALYNASSIKDAVYAGGAIYVAKSTASEPPSPLVKVDIVTHDAVPIKIRGNVSFCLAADDRYVYGLSYDALSGKTAVFSTTFATGISGELISFAGEDMAAFIVLCNEHILTNLGRSPSILSYNTAKKSNIRLGRAAAFPATASLSSSRTAVVGKDGSVTWYTNGGSKALASWHLKGDAWLEY